MDCNIVICPASYKYTYYFGLVFVPPAGNDKEIFMPELISKKHYKF